MNQIKENDKRRFLTISLMSLALATWLAVKAPLSPSLLIMALRKSGETMKWPQVESSRETRLWAGAGKEREFKISSYRYLFY